MSGMSFVMIVFGVILNTIAQLCLKQGMISVGSISLELTGIFDLIIKTMSSYYIILGLTCYVASFAVWLVVLSKVDVSMAYPMLSVGYIVTAICGYYFWGESLGLYKIMGIFLIIVGVAVMFKE